LSPGRKRALEGRDGSIRPAAGERSPAPDHDVGGIRRFSIRQPSNHHSELAGSTGRTTRDTARRFAKWRRASRST
jgi:hypothetical protein